MRWLGVGGMHGEFVGRAEPGQNWQEVAEVLKLCSCACQQLGFLYKNIYCSVDCIVLRTGNVKCCFCFLQLYKNETVVFFS